MTRILEVVGMGKSKITPIGQAIVDLINNYEIAKESGYVRKPISYALYHTWQMWDKKEKDRTNESVN